MVALFHLVPQVHYGPGAVRYAGEILSDKGVRRALVVSDPGVLAAGVADPVLASIKDAGLAFEVFDAVRTNPDERQVDAAAQRYRDAGCDGVVGVGGGSAMDVAKCAATLVSNGACRDVGGIVEYEDGRRPVTEPPPPLVLVPTTAGTGSEVVSGAIITDSGRAFKMHVVAVPADAALCDASLTLTLPPEPTAAAGIDALAHAIGAYTSVERQPLADAYAVYAIRTIARWLPRAVADGSDLAARDEMMLGSLTSGISMKGGGAVDHAFAHAVNALFDVHHGVGVAMFLPAAMKFNRPHMPERFADIAAALGAPDAVTAVRELIAACPIPGPAALGITPADIPALTAKVLDDKFHLGLNPVPVTEADARNVLQSVIGKESVVGR